LIAQRPGKLPLIEADHSLLGGVDVERGVVDRAGDFEQSTIARLPITATAMGIARR
jgi:hypothetical protein